MPEVAVDGQVQENALAGAVVVVVRADPENTPVEEGRRHDEQQQVQPEPPELAASPKARVLGPDLLRGWLMMLQAIDHCAMAVGAWPHGVARDAEVDGAPMSQWNATVPFVARMLTHLCAPGFMFLLGLGVVYFGRSRSKLGWGPGRLARHFAVRGVVLAGLNQVFITLPAGNFRVWLVNVVLIALAVNYVLAGLLWIALNALEATLAAALAAVVDDPERQPLLGRASTTSLPATVAWHVHTALLVAVTAAAAWWNVALSPHGGRCADDAGPATTPPVHGLAFDFWFYPIFSDRLMSGFPPLAWLSYATFGLLYGRLVTARPWRPAQITAGTAAAGAACALLFVLTRLLRFGNLSEDCLHMPEHHDLAGRNPYLASVRSFLYVVKYPPDLAFFGLTMAANLLLLAFFGWSPRTAARLPALLVFGTSALFFYLVHMWLYMGLGVPATFLFGAARDETDPVTGRPVVGVGNGVVVWVVYALGLAILYPVCKRYGRFKSAQPPDSVWRFF